MKFEYRWYFMKWKNQHTKRTNIWDVIAVLVAWLIALALIYIVLIKFKILNSF